MRLSTSTIATALLLLVGGQAHAEQPRDNVRMLPYDTRIDLAVTSVGALWLVTSELLKPVLVPEKCRWCYRAADGSSQLNSIDGWIRLRLVWHDTRAADLASSVLAFIVMPLAQMGVTAAAAANDSALGGFPVDALLITEATVVAANVNQLAKFLFARERPFVHFLPRAPSEIRALTATPSDDNLSFYSGHTNLAFALATSSGTVATMRNYRLAPLVWASGLTSAFSVGYLRMAADKHYFSDVTVGVVAGSLIGIGIPLLFHNPRGETTPPSASAQALVAPPMNTPINVAGSW